MALLRAGPVADLSQQVRRDQPEQDRQAGERLREEVPAPQEEAEASQFLTHQSFNLCSFSNIL